MSKLAEIFTKIDQSSAQIETLSGQIIDAIRDAKAYTVEAFNELVSEAYQENGWSRQIGRPVEGSVDRPAPPTIRNYVSVIRAAYKIGLKVHTYRTLRELRTAARVARMAAIEPVEQPEELAGVSIKASKEITGALFHDLVVIWEHLSDEDRAAMDVILNRARNRFQKKTPLRLVA